VNIAIAQLKYLVSRTELILRGLFCLHALLFSPLSSAAFVEPISYSFYGHSYQFTDQSFYWQLYQPDEINLDLKVINQRPISFTKLTSNWLIDKRNEWSSMIGNTGSQLDLFFAGEQVEYKANASYLRLALETKFSKQGELSLEPVFKFKLDLPTLKKRLKLVIESHIPEQETLSEANIDSSLQDEDPSISTTTGAFKYFFGTVKNWRTSTSIGVRLNRMLNPFWRMRMKREWDLDYDWYFKAQQRLYYFHDDGWGERTQFIFEKPFYSYFITSKSEAKWRHNERLMRYAQVFSIKKKLSSIRAIKYELGILFENQPNVIVTDYYFKMTYRRLLYKDWLFYEMSPELLFPREDSFKANPSVLMRFEVKFSNL